MIKAYHIQLFEFSLLSGIIMEKSIVYVPTIFTRPMFSILLKAHVLTNDTTIGFSRLENNTHCIAPDKDSRQLGIYPPLFGLIGYFKLGISSFCIGYLSESK